MHTKVHLMKKLNILAVMFLVSACSFQSAKVLTKKAYTGEGLDRVFVIVISDNDTESALKYYKQFLVDSLQHNNIAAEAVFKCCVDKKSDLKEEVVALLPDAAKHRKVLSVVINKAIIGYGTTSTRELQLNLLEFDKKEMSWSGKLTCSFDWFISDANYRAVANKMVKATLKELRKQHIIQENM